MAQEYRTPRAAPSDKGVLSVVIDAPPMNLIGRGSSGYLGRFVFRACARLRSAFSTAGSMALMSACCSPCVAAAARQRPAALVTCVSTSVASSARKRSRGKLQVGC
jgi:hypothetical protein